MGWDNFLQVVSRAAVVATVSGFVASAAIQLLKQILGVFKHKLPGRYSATLSGVFSAALTAYILSTQGVGWDVAVAASLVALFTPQPVYDVVSRLKRSKEAAPDETKTPQKD